MKKRLVLISMTMVMMLSCMAFAEETESETTDTAACEESNNSLPAADIVDYLYNQDNGNVVISDMSINMALSMLLEGAGGETQTQLEEYLGADVATNRENNESILSDLSPLENTTLEIANSLWYDDSLAESGQEISQDYVTTLESYYNASISEADFSDGATADAINDWCAENTNDLINQIVDPNSIADQSAILANALYFLGTWTDPFPDAVEETFYGLEQETTVDMMHDQVYNYCENDYATAFIKYYYDDYAFVGILPKEDGDFDLSDLDISGLLNSQTDEYDVVIKMPKFTVEYSATLNDALKEKGLTDIFSSDADLSGIADFMYVSEILHKTYISIDEVGTEAAAVTAVMLETASAMAENEIKQVYLDRPFAFAVIDSSNNILFLGKIVDL
ncbi:MAG: serpin family protein [Clostridiales bacterium]|nr:serpin family protein [Clostridiales bacterium]